MKKFRSLSILLALALVLSMLPSFTVSAAEPGYVYDFYYQSDFDNYTLTGTNQCAVTWEDHAMKMVSEVPEDDPIGDPNFYINDIADGDFDGEDYPYVAFCLKNLSDATEYEGHFGTSTHPISGSTVFHFDVDPNMTEYKTYVFNMPVQNQKYVNLINGPDGVSAQEGATQNVVAEMEEGDTFWEGTISSFRFDGMYRGGRSGLSEAGDTLYISWIGFFATEEDAKNFAPDHSVEKTPEPTPDPTSYDGTPYGLLVFNTDDDIFYDFFSETGRNQIADVYFDSDKGCWSIDIAQGGDPFIELGFGTLAYSEDMDVVSADDCKIVQLGVRVNTNEGAKSGSFYYQTSEHGGYSEAQNILYNYVTTDELQCVNVDLTKAKAWEGEVANCRFDAFTSSKEDTTVDVYYIAFFNNKTAADAFAAQIAEKGLDALPTPAPTPTKAPTAEPTEKPTEAPATDAPVATDVPDVTEKAGTATDKPADDVKDGNGNKWVIPVIIVAAVVVCAAVVGIIVAKKKKK